jgi:outer membrane protein
MKPLTCAAGLLIASAVAVCAADSATNLSLSLQDCIAMALEKNLDLRIERYNPQIALFNLSAVRAGYEPELNLSGQHDHTKSRSATVTEKTDADSFSGSLGGLTPWGMTYGLSSSASDLNRNVLTPFDSSLSSVALEVTQPLLKNFWIDSTRLNISLAKNAVKGSELGLKLTIMNLVTSVETAYYRMESGYEQVKVQSDALKLAQQLLEENHKRVQVGALAPLDEKQSEAEAAARKADLLAAQQQLETLKNDLKSLMGDDFASWNTQSIEPSETLGAERQLFNLQDSWAQAFEKRPDYLQAKLGLENQGFHLKFNRNQIYPQLEVFGAYRYDGGGNEFANSLDDLSHRNNSAYTYGGRLTIPLGNGAARNTYKASKATYEQLVLGLKQTEQNIMIGIDNAIKAAQSDYERVGATKEAREYAEAALAAEQKKLENGKSTNFEVLGLQNKLTTARSEEIKALVQYNIDLAVLAQAQGTTLERRKIDLEVK